MRLHGFRTILHGPYANLHIFNIMLQGLYTMSRGFFTTLH